MREKISIPILFIAFNRPEITKISFQKIRESMPNKIYIAIDGPRKENSHDKEQVAKVKEILQNINWTCEVFYKFNDFNIGAEKNVSSAISWAFQNEEFLIIIEDDIIAPYAFLKFAQDLLIKYKDNEKISVISASNFTPLNINEESDYFFSRYAHSGGGWATWKRSWEIFDLNTQVKPEHLTLKFLRSITNSRKEAMFYRKKFKKMNERGKGKNSWDRVGNYLNMIENRMGIVPRINLTSNIGTYGVHAKGRTSLHFLEYDENFVVNKHPESIELNLMYDRHHFKKYICHGNGNVFKKVYSKLKKLI